MAEGVMKYLNNWKRHAKRMKGKLGNLLSKRAERHGRPKPGGKVSFIITKYRGWFVDTQI
jgi:hypothetical protein